jgi:hypothetical protein
MRTFLFLSPRRANRIDSSTPRVTDFVVRQISAQVVLATANATPDATIGRNDQAFQVRPERDESGHEAGIRAAETLRPAIYPLEPC